MSIYVHGGAGSGGGSSDLGLLHTLAVTKAPAKTEYYQGDQLDLAGIEVTATYLSEGPVYSTKVVTAECTYSPNTGDTLSVDGIQTITITFTEGDASVQTTTTVSVKPFIVDWATGDDTQIERMIAGHHLGTIDLHDYWSVGQERTVTLTTGEAIQMVLMHPSYPLADGSTAAFVVGMKDCLNATRQMNSSSTNAGGWNGCAMRSWLNSTIYNQIPESFRQNLKLMNVWTANGGNQSGTTGIYSQDYLALPAEKEVFGSNSYADSSIESQLFRFDWYKTAANRIKKVNGSNDWWWERSPYRSSTVLFCYVDSSGGANFNGADGSDGVSFFGCI